MQILALLLLAALVTGLLWRHYRTRLAAIAFAVFSVLFLVCLGWAVWIILAFLV